MQKLTAKQEAFCQEYIKCHNITEAYQRVYNCKRDTARIKGYGLTQKDYIKSRLKQLQAKAEDQTLLEATKVINFWALTIDNTEIDIKDRIKASELAGRHLGLFDKQQVKEENATTDEDLRALLED
jgi:phage terminase small subunit